MNYKFLLLFCIINTYFYVINADDEDTEEVLADPGAITNYTDSTTTDTSQLDTADDVDTEEVLADPGASTNYTDSSTTETSQKVSADSSSNLVSSDSLDSSSSSTGSSSSQCNQKRFNLIYRDCNHKSDFTDYQIERARVYIQNRFANAAIAPQKPKCQKLRIRRDFKCMCHDDKMKFINTFIKLYKNGFIDKLTQAHTTYWGSAHKCAEGTSFHRWMSVVVDKALMQIDPTVSLPYWDNGIEFAAPENSIMWYYFGTSGTAANNYCITDGPFKNVKINYPETRCIRRQWLPNGTIPRWEGPEFTTSYTQRWPTDFIGFFTEAFNQHFKKHLCMGGYNGDMSVPSAPNDPIFLLYHNHQVDQLFLKWFMIDEANVVPLAFNLFGKFDYQTNQSLPVNISVDTMNYFTNHTIVEALQMGYGELCYVTDQFVDIINKLLDNIPPKLPAAVQRLKQALPANKFQYYFPNFANNNATYFLYDLADVGNCVQTCKKLPQVAFYNSTANGIREYNAFKTVIGIDVSPFADTGEAVDLDFTTVLNSYNYCSPYN